jgi:hypothetical protein
MTIITKTKNFFKICFLIVVPAFAAIADTTGTAQDKGGTKGLKVTLLLYSGRPNPTFFLDDKGSRDSVQNLFGKLKAMEKSTKDTMAPPVLGFNGIVVENIDQTIKQFPEVLTIKKGVVEVKQKGIRFLNDGGYKMEVFLLGKALEKKVIDENAFKKIKGAK